MIRILVYDVIEYVYYLNVNYLYGLYLVNVNYDLKQGFLCKMVLDACINTFLITFIYLTYYFVIMALIFDGEIVLILIFNDVVNYMGEKSFFYCFITTKFTKLLIKTFLKYII